MSVARWAGRVDPLAVGATVAQALGAGLEPGPDGLVVILDTADRALCRAGLVLGHLPSEGRVVLWRARGEVPWAARAASAPVRAAAMSRGRVKVAVREAAGQAELAPVLHLLRVTRSGVVVEGEERCEVRVVTWEAPDIAAAPRPLAVEVEVEGRGMAARRRGLRQALLEIGLEAGGVAMRGLVKTALGERTGKGVTLDPGAPVALAVRRVIAPLVQALREGAPGVLADTDPEHLHEWRVALRSLRAVLSELPEALPEGSRRKLKRRLQELQQETGALRDLDVYLESELEPGLRELLLQRRIPERERVAAILGGRKLQRVLRSLTKVLADRDVPDDGGAPIGAWIRLRIYEAWSRVLAQGRALAAGSPDEDFHTLRKSCKRLRYLLEHFASVLPATDLVGELKRVQTRLGELQDLVVQEVITAVPEGRVAEARQAALAAWQRLDRPEVERTVRVVTGLVSALVAVPPKADKLRAGPRRRRAS